MFFNIVNSLVRKKVYSLTYWKAKIKQDKQPERSSHMGWCHVKVKSSEQQTTKSKVSFTEKKVNFKESFLFKYECCILKKVIY